jgi:hypothetical protein
MLRAIRVRSSSIATLRHLPPAQVAAVIAAARARSDVRDLASWVVSALRDTRTPDSEDAAALDLALAARQELTHDAPPRRSPPEPGPPAGLKIARARAAHPDRDESSRLPPLRG